MDNYKNQSDQPAILVLLVPQLDMGVLVSNIGDGAVFKNRELSCYLFYKKK